MRFGLRVALILVLGLYSQKADACQCDTIGPPCQNYFNVDAVFAGRVQSIARIEGTPELPSVRQLVLLSIERPFRGVEGTTVEVATGLGGGDCGYLTPPER